MQIQTTVERVEEIGVVGGVGWVGGVGIISSMILIDDMNKIIEERINKQREKMESMIERLFEIHNW